MKSVIYKILVTFGMLLGLASCFETKSNKNFLEKDSENTNNTPYLKNYTQKDSGVSFHSEEEKIKLEKQYNKNSNVESSIDTDYNFDNREKRGYNRYNNRYSDNEKIIIEPYKDEKLKEQEERWFEKK